MASNFRCDNANAHNTACMYATKLEFASEFGRIWKSEFHSIEQSIRWINFM